VVTSILGGSIDKGTSQILFVAKKASIVPKKWRLEQHAVPYFVGLEDL
jgi:hypothetical protein